MHSVGVEDYFALQSLNNEYWLDVDRHQGTGITRFWAEDSVFKLDEAVLEGRDAIERFYGWRTNRAARVSLHVATNLCIRMSAPDRAELISIVTLYAADGDAPIAGSTPIGVAVADDLCSRGADGVWRYARRELRRLFVGAGEVTMPPASLAAS